MANTTSTVSYYQLTKRQLGEAACQNCGKLVRVLLPFTGCVFCSKCMQASSVSAWTAQRIVNILSSPLEKNNMES